MAREEPRASNEMVSIHDIFPTLASIIGGRVPTDRPMDGVDQSAFIIGRQPLAAISDLPEAVCQFRRKPGAGRRGRPPRRGNGYPAIFNIEHDQREEVNVGGTDAWVVGQYMRLIGEYQKSLEKYSNPKAVNMTQFGRP